MDKKKKIIVIVAAIIIVAVIVYFIFFKDKAQAPASLVGKIPGSEPSPSLPSGTNPEVAEAFPIQQGSHGDKTKSLQMALNRIGGNTNKITEDGDFGNNTRVKLITTVPTNMYSAGPSLSQSQLTAIIAMGNNA